MESGKFNLISPTSLLLLTSLIFLCALLFPPFIYEIFINEEYKAFMNFYLLFVFFIDIIFFSIGLLLISSQNKTTISPEIGIRNFNSMLFIMSVLSLINLLYSIANISNYGIGLDDYITANASYYKNNDEIRLQGELFNFLCIVFFWNIFYFYLHNIIKTLILFKINH